MRNEITIRGNHAIMKLNRRGESVFCVLDAADAKRLASHPWTKSTHGYVVSDKLRMHRLIVDAKPGETVDHINHNRLDNRRCNLRIVTKSVNTRHRKVVQSNVCFKPKTGRWRVTFCIDYQPQSFGCYDTPEEAAEIAAAIRARLCGGEVFTPEKIAAMRPKPRVARVRKRKFSQEAVAQMKDLRRAGCTLDSLSRRFGISMTHVSRLVRI